ncbi:MAG: hypothetical protein FWD66_00390 [Paludibacter sp.]|nr:hypothetical protein [Paludibacter sp.]
MLYFSIAGFIVAIDEKIFRYKYIAHILQNFLVQPDENPPLLAVGIGQITDFKKFDRHSYIEELSIESFYRREGNRFLCKMQCEETCLCSEFYEKENYTFEMIVDFNQSAKVGAMLYYLLRWACCFAFLHRQTLGVHSSTIVYQNKSVLFLGKSGMGKSTHSQLWLENIEGTELLNDDAPFVQIYNNQVLTWGSPWSGKTHCLKNMSAPTAAFVFLKQTPYNKIRKLSLYEALTVILDASRFYYFNDELFTDKNYEIISEILKKVPIYYLECLPQAAAAQLVFDILKSDNIL